MQEPLTLSFATGAGRLQIEIARESDPASPSHGDARLSMTVASGDFAGRGYCWVERDTLDRFARAMNGMQERVEGQAELRSMSPGELALTIHSVSARGVFAVEGQLGTRVQGDAHAFPHAVTFGFEVEFAEIQRAARQLAELTAGTSWNVVEMTRRNGDHA
jgi:hypothetical protein